MTGPDLVALLRAAVASTTRTEPASVGEDSSLRALGVNSMRALRIAARLERELGAPVAPWPLLEHDRLGDAAAAIVPGTDEPPRHRPGPWRPLSHAEQSQWYLDWSEPGATRYVFSGAIRLRGPVDPAALGAALSAVVRRHEPLRTRYGTGPDGVPRAVAADPYPVALPVTGEPLDQVVRAERETPFDLTGGRLLRARLVRLAPEDHALVLAAHHIAVDGWSFGVLLRELGGRSPELTAGYPDAVAAEAATWRADGPRQREWWRGYLADAPPALDVPGDLPVGPGATGAGRVLRFAVEPAVTAAVRALPATPYAVLFTAFAVVLHRRAGRDDLLVGTPLANRARPRFHDLIGMFVNTVVLRSRAGRDTTFAALLRATRDGLLGAMTHQEVPLPEITAAAQGAARDPLVRVMFDLHSFPPGELALPGVEVLAGDGGPLTLNSFETPGSQAKFDLTLTMEDTGEALLGALEYRTDRYTRRWADGFVEDLLAVLTEATRDPDTRVRDLAAGRGEPSVVRGEPAPPGEWTVHGLVGGRPEAVAVVDGDEALDYAELDRRAGELAGRLRALGVGAGTTVALLAERSAGLVVDVLAVLRAGGAFLPLDPRHPVDRMHAMLADGDASLLLTREHLTARAGRGAGRDLGAGRRVITLRHTESTRRDAGQADTAYVLFTSGSTGRPKGVAVSHRSLAVAALTWRREFGLGEGDVVAQIAGCAFDVFCGELVRALGTGARLAIVPDDVVLDPVRLHALLRDAGVTCAEFVPSVLAPLVDLGRELPSLRRVVIGVEPWTAGEQARLRALLRPEAVVHNTYGLTEATIDSTGEILTGTDGLPAEHRFPVGWPFSSTTVYVLDESRRPVTVGLAGEVWIGGTGVAQGYVGRAAHTADRFRPDPFGDPGTRMYRTGDRGRLLPDGRLVLLGRLDRQHKVRGTRVDLEEVEAVLAGAPGVRRAVVVPEPAGLVAYLVREPSAATEPREVAAHAARWLPRTVCPVRYAVLDRPPLTPNGKIDVAALAGVPTQPVAAPAPARPASTTEREIARLCAEVIEGGPVGEVDPAADFFELGGHSLLLARWIGLVRDRFAVDLPIREVLLRPTVARVAELVEAGAPAARTPTAGHTRIRWSARPQRGGDDERP
ncbi:hypothetical protein BLA60_03240 [Actinophytocola xinjiangensis]|uniref:Carrier domain-containing protein n=1 Tax=Actinophytocola xinjiangensis TaxID=485602 RepID=A0A7Z0WSY7_9PSEU|nr:non-ribosomal peptide synthetase [Actinophytocola xinjiangensis]OLF14177.1 hypothetical protein BLA60_03240 [Actinophytocola xinjiangensis]